MATRTRRSLALVGLVLGALTVPSIAFQTKETPAPRCSETLDELSEALGEARRAVELIAAIAGSTDSPPQMRYDAAEIRRQDQSTFDATINKIIVDSWNPVHLRNAEARWACTGVKPSWLDDIGR